MASQGPTIAGSGSDDSTVGSVSWSNPGNVTADDASYATATLATGANQTSHYLFFTGFGFSVPAGATIDGVVVDIKRKVSAGTTYKDNSVKLVKAGAVTGSDKSAAATWPTTEATATFGSSSDLWGATLGPSDVNASNFGFALSATNPSLSRIGSVNAGWVTVYYTEAGAARQQTLTLLGCGA